MSKNFTYNEFTVDVTDTSQNGWMFIIWTENGGKFAGGFKSDISAINAAKKVIDENKIDLLRQW